MPTYVYRCEGGHQYEKRESFSAPAEQDCDSCGRQARRVPVASAVIFKGSGWYKTDSRGSSNGASESSPSGSSPKKSETTDSSTSGGGDTAKTPAASETKSHGHSHGPGTHTH